MNPVLEALKERLEAARARHTEVAREHQIVSARLNAAAAEFNVWNAAYSYELKEQDKRDKLEAEEKAKQIPLPGTMIAPVEAVSEPEVAANHEAAELHQEPVNKTELVREALRIHHAGLTAGDLWKRFQNQISSRPYLYSILKRLRDKDEVSLRRGKYILKPKPIELKPGDGMEAQTIQ